MRIHTDHNGVSVNAISTLADGTNVEGHHYQVLAGAKTINIDFQRGTIPEAGVNGLTNEALLAIVSHRLEFFQKGAFACRENALALTKIQEAGHWLEHRTKARQARGVEGTHAV